MQQLFLVLSLLVLAAAGSQQYVAFDAASASSTHSAGNLAGSPAFAAQQALSAGSGYWSRLALICCLVLLLCWRVRDRCSSGSHAPGQSAALRAQRAYLNSMRAGAWVCSRSTDLYLPVLACLRCHMDGRVELSPWGSRSRWGLCLAPTAPTNLSRARPCCHLAGSTTQPSHPRTAEHNLPPPRNLAHHFLRMPLHASCAEPAPPFPQVSKLIGLTRLGR